MPKLQRNHYCLFIWHDGILGVRLCFQDAQVPKHILLPTRSYSNSYTLWSRTSIQEIILSTHYMSSTALGTADRAVIQRSKSTYPNRVYILATIFLICVCVCVCMYATWFSLMISWPISSPSITPQLYSSRKNLEQWWHTWRVFKKFVENMYYIKKLSIHFKNLLDQNTLSFLIHSSHRLCSSPVRCGKHAVTQIRILLHTALWAGTAE